MSDEPQPIVGETRSLLRPAFPSEKLRETAELAENLPALRPLVGDWISFLVVLDASAVQAELRWRVGSRRNPGARSNLHELLESGVVTAVAPEHLQSEIEEHLPRIAFEHAVALETVKLEWTNLERLIRYVSPMNRRPRVNCPDPKDLPYFQLSEQIAADFIWTRDRHFLPTGAPNMAAGLDTTLRNYARATSLLAGFKTTSGFAIVLSVQTLAAAGSALVKVIRRIPPGVTLCFALAIAGLLLHPKSRQWILDRLESLLKFLDEMKPLLLSLTEDTLAEISGAATTATQTEARIRGEIPMASTCRITAVQTMRAVCLKAAKPLAIVEIEKRVRHAGYQTRSRRFQSYLRRLLRTHAEFAEVSPGYWVLKTA